MLHGIPTIDIHHIKIIRQSYHHTATNKMSVSVTVNQQNILHIRNFDQKYQCNSMAIQIQSAEIIVCQNDNKS
jgi:hypothetical protein